MCDASDDASFPQEKWDQHDYCIHLRTSDGVQAHEQEQAPAPSQAMGVDTGASTHVHACMYMWVHMGT